jgi:thymidine kinase
MHPENSIHFSERRGWIEVICGSMFSGKTEELIRRLKRARIAKQRVEIFKPLIDTRFSGTDIISHDENSITSIPVETSGQIITFCRNVEVVGIDEAQFFDEGLVEVCNRLASGGTRVIVAGLDLDYRGLPFGPVPDIMAIAEYVTKVHAVCMRCGDPAHYSYRTRDIDSLVVLGEMDIYEPLCRRCFDKALGKLNQQ